MDGEKSIARKALPWVLAGIGLYLIFFGKRTVMKFTQYLKGETWDKMLPAMQQAVTNTINDAQAQGLDVMFFEGYRSIEDEQKQIDKGTSKLSDPSNTAHAWGFAVDLVFANALGLPSWPPLSDPRWSQLTAIAAKYGLTHPISWDGPHYQLGGLTVASIKQSYDNPDDWLSDNGVAV